MRSILLCILISLATTVFAQEKKGTALFVIEEGGRYGYINQAGKKVIPTVYRSAGEFSEGLAAVRSNGTYGYIDTSNQWVVPPRFDYGMPFSDGLAVVYINGEPLYINREGHKAIELPFPAALGSFLHGKALIRTYSNHYGMINKKGEHVIDTMFLNPVVFNEDGLAVVAGLKHNPYPRRDELQHYETGIIDTNGHFLVPYGKYSEINAFENGYAKATLLDTIHTKGDSTTTGYIDMHGRFLFVPKCKKNSWVKSAPYNGLAVINLYKYWHVSKSYSYSTEFSYEGYIDSSGNVVINDTNFVDAYPFSENRAFVRDAEHHYFIINKKGQRVGHTYYAIDETGFVNGSAFVNEGSGWGNVDTNGNFTLILKYDYSGYDAPQDGYIYFKDTIDERLIGIANRQGNIIFPPRIQDFDHSGFINGVLKIRFENKLSYLNRKGEIIWQRKSDSTAVQYLNIDFMNRGYYLAYSKPDGRGGGGWYRSPNVPQKITKAGKFPKNKLSVIASPREHSTWEDFCRGFKVYIVNTTTTPIKFNAEDSRLDMRVQAKDKNGKWQYIEYLPHSWCGNSYHTVTLDAKSYWTFTAPVYEGDFATKLRIEVRYINPVHPGKKLKGRERVIYSNEFDGSVNPGQFWRKRKYHPSGIMDPYNE